MTLGTSSELQIEKLRQKLDEDSELASQFEESLRIAKALAYAELDRGLFAALDWPESIPRYLEYLARFSRWVPQPSSDKVWIAPGTDEGQEIFDRLCHFYWLIDQKVGPDGKIVEDDDWLSRWLVDYARVWGDFLDTADSFSPQILQSFLDNSPEYAVHDSMVDGRPNAPSGWLTFNQFFARQLNPGLRPIASPADNTVVVSPADCTFRNSFSIGPDSKIKEIRMKKTHQFATVQGLLHGSPFGDDFANGTFVHYFLGPYSYHRFHTPVAGLVRECRSVQGLVYLEVRLKDRQFDAPDTSEGGYEFAQARGILILDTTGSPFGDVGLVGVVPVGMCQVSSVNMTATVGCHLLKGDELGYFLFGGSDMILLFQEGTNPRIFTGQQYRHYGTTIATVDRR